VPKLRRRELYDLVWSMPMTKLADQFGISDVGLSKICDRYKISTPPRGYWARIEAGKRVRQLILVSIKELDAQLIEINPGRDNLPEEVRRAVDEARTNRRSLHPVRKVASAPISTFVEVSQPHKAIRKSVDTLRNGVRDKEGFIKAIGPGECGLAIGAQSVERTIFILDALARALELKSISIRADGERMVAEDQTDCVPFNLIDRRKRIDHVQSESELAARAAHEKNVRRGITDWAVISALPIYQRYDIIPSGELSIELHSWPASGQKKWKDGRSRLLESCIDEIVVGIEAGLAAAASQRIEKARLDAARANLAHRRDMFAKRSAREGERARLLAQMVRNQRKIEYLRAWLEKQATFPEDPSLLRMAEWIGGEILQAEAFIDPVRLGRVITELRLFPENDDLYDPLGDPPPKRNPWDQDPY